jgi:urea transport system permease protein
MTLVAILVVQILVAIATIVLFTAGLAIIFGMMRVINLAHGEFMMLGGYAALKSYQAGLNLWLAMLVVAPAFVGIVGIVVERVLISRLYGRMIDSLLATWGLSLFLTGLVTTIFGNTTVGVPTPLGSFHIGQFGSGTYNIVLLAITMLLMAIMFYVLRFTKLGLIARGTMQNREMTAALGLNPRKIYSITFAVGAAVTGLAGGLLVPLTGVIPTMGGAFVAKAFITVICGGPAMISGTVSASGVFGVINQLVSYAVTPVIGEAALLLAAVVLLRALPDGLSGRLFKGAV